MQALKLLLVLFLPTLALAGEELFPGYSWQPLGDGIYLHAQNQPLAAPVDGNTTVIVGRTAVMVIDTGINPAVARAVVAKIRSVTDRPVTHIVNTHWHDDHVNGNYVYKAAFPDATIIAHRETLKSLHEGWQEMEDGRREAYAGVDTDALREQAAGFEEAEPDKAIGYRLYAGYIDALRPELPTLGLVYPDTDFDERFEVDLGDRTVELRWLGEGNTAGDIVAWLPEEQFLITGDLLVAPIPFAFDAPMRKWPDTLNSLTAFKAKTIIPGHGPVQHDHEYLEQVSALVEHVVSEVRSAHDNGTAYENLAETVDLTSHRRQFTHDDVELDWAWQSWFVTPGLKSAWVALGYPLPEEG